MSEYEDRYPDAYGRAEETDLQPRKRQFLRWALPRQARGDNQPAIVVARAQPPSVKVVDINALGPSERPAAAPPPVERPRQSPGARSAREICDDVAEQLKASPFIDASGIAITVDDAEVLLEGTINSLIAISLAKALASNVPGVARVQVRLQVRQAPRSYETASSGA